MFKKLIDEDSTKELYEAIQINDQSPTYYYEAESNQPLLNNYSIQNHGKTSMLVDLSDKNSNAQNIKNSQCINSKNNNINNNNMLKHDFKIIHLNARSLFPKIEDLRLLTLELTPQILCISESWLTDKIPDLAVKLPNYHIFRFDSTDNYGSVCIYTLNNLSTKVLDIPDIICSPKFDFLVISTQYLKHKSIIVATIYIHPPVNSQTYDDLNKLMRYLTTLNKRIYILGDFNINLLDKNNIFAIKLKTFLATYGLIQVIKEPTRITEYSKTLIDLCITNDKNIKYAKSISDNNLADHNTIMISLDLVQPKPDYYCTKTFRTTKNYNTSQFNQILKLQPFHNIYAINNDNTAVKIFNELFISSLNAIAPLVTKTFKHRISIPFPKYLKIKRIEKNRLYKIAQSGNCNKMDWINYKCYKKNLDKETNAYRSSYMQEKLRKSINNPKQLWNYMNQITPTKQKTNTFLDGMHNLTTANAFNAFFSTVGEKTFLEVENMQSISSTRSIKSNKNYPMFLLNPVTTIEIKQVINSLKNSNSVGYDNITTKFVKDATESLLQFITYLINLSITNNSVPEIWKTAIIVPIYKKADDKTNPANYRPISVLPVLSKVLEKIVAKQLWTHLEKYKIINKNQFGFRINSSTNNALNYICNTLYTSLDNNRISLLILLDLSKAFDSISHEMLLETLHYYNIKSQWFVNYLSNRIQVTKIDDFISDPNTIHYGVPQGSVLGPILFVIYINEIFSILNELKDEEVSYDIIGYADDTQLIFTSEFHNYDILVKFATKVTNILIQRFADLRMKINTKKSQCMLICSKTQNNKIDDAKKHIIINNDKLGFVNSVNNLGITFDWDMKFKTHTNNLHKKILNKLKYISKTKAMHTFTTRKLLVEHLALSPLYYCCEIWRDFSRQQASQIQSLINFGAKIIFCKGKYDSASDLVIKLKWLNSDQLHTYFLSCTVYKQLKNLTNSNIAESFVICSGIKTRNGCTKLSIPNTNNKYGKRSLNFKTAYTWNLLPDNIKSAQSISQFKRALKSFLLSDVSADI